MSVSEQPPQTAPRSAPVQALPPRPGGRAAVIVNPNAAQGRTGRRWPALEGHIREALPGCDIQMTTGPHHATTLTRAALRAGYERIISVGGDGTHYEVTNGFFEEGAPLNPHAVFGILNYGTGGDLARTLRVPAGRRAFRYLTEGRTTASDVGRITYRRADGTPGACYWLNTCRIGMGGEVVHRVNNNSKLAGGFFSFAAGTLLTLLNYRDKRMHVTVDGLALDQTVKEIVIAIGQFDGGGMHVAPNARIDDGLFEVYIIGRLTVGAALWNLPLIYRGEMTKRPDLVKYFRARSITVDCSERVYINTDGEMPGYVPASVEILPNALNVITGWATRAG